MSLLLTPAVRAQAQRGFNPASLFLPTTDGTFPANLLEPFTDTAGTTPATWGDSVARINDQSPNGRNAVQSSAALRWVLGRAPIEGRNLLTRTEEFDNAVWEKNRASVSENISTAPDGTTTADRLESTVAAGTVNSFARLLFTPETGKTYTASVYAKPGTSDFVELAIRASTSAAAVHAVINLTNGSIINTNTTPTVTEDANGFYRISISGGSADSSGGVYECRTSNGTISNRSAGVGGGPVIWGAQLEEGSEATPYQRVGNAFDVTDAGAPSFAYLRPDISDDVMPTVFPNGFSGDVMIFGRRGSWIQRNVTIASAGSLNIGPDTINDGPAGLLAALGDIVGWIAVERTLTNPEVARLVQWHRVRGAAELLGGV